jgi:hypothetical protein
MSRLHVWLVLALVIGIAAGCGGGSKNSATAIPTSPAGKTATAVPPAATPDLPTAPPPTWTPRPTLTEPPRATIEVTYVRPTLPTFVPPTYTPSPVSPTPTPPGPLLFITPDMINQRLVTEMAAGSGGLFEAPPTVSFQEGALVISLNVLTTPGQANTARPVQIEAAIAVEEGRITLSTPRAEYADDHTPFESEMVGQLVQTVQSDVGRLIVEAYNATNPSSPNFLVLQMYVADNGITIQTQMLPG